LSLKKDKKKDEKPFFKKPVTEKIKHVAKNFKGAIQDPIDKFLFLNEILKYGDENISHLNREYGRKLSFLPMSP